MQDVHTRIHAFKRAHPNTEDPIPPLADALADAAALLCFDEFQVNDIADAMILGRLFQALFARAVVVVATSNTAPDHLFEGQPGRDAFLPFIALIKQHLAVLVLDGHRDYRRARLRELATWHVPADAHAQAALDRAFSALTGGAPARPERLVVMGRTLAVPRAAESVARFAFAQLCGQPLGAGDYLAIATHYEALVLDDIPRLGPDNHDEARRFINLVDALYEHRVKLIASAQATPDQLYEHGDGAAAFRRTASRLEEMQSADWRAMPHLT
jgi:cell division protein ZapE